jgi:hypothetical protein
LILIPSLLAAAVAALLREIFFEFYSLLISRGEGEEGEKHEENFVFA